MSNQKRNTTPKYKLRYFNKRARGELIRMIFVYAGQEFEDEQFTFEQWPKIKPTTPNGKVPVLEYDGTTMTESLAIARFLGRQFGLCGKDNREQYCVDLILDDITLLLDELIAEYLEGDQSKKGNLMDTLTRTSIPAHLEFLNKKMKEFPTKFLVGNKITLADLAVHNVLTTLVQRDGNILKKFDLLEGNRKAVEEHPRIKEYLRNRPEIDM